MRKQFSKLLLGFLVCLSLSATSVADMEEVMQRFQQDHPNARFIGAQFYEHESFFDEAGTSSTIWGDVLSTGTSQIDSAWNHVFEVRDLLGSDIGELVPKVQADGNVMIGVMYDRDTDSYGFSTFRFEQNYHGIPVFRSGVGFLVRNDDNNSLMMSTFNVREMDGFQVNNVAPAAVTQQMLANVDQMMNALPAMRSLLGPVAQPAELVTSEIQQVIFAGANEEIAEPRLAVQFIAERGDVLENAEQYQKFLIVAAVDNGEILLQENQIHQVDVTGTVNGRATQGLNSLECGPEASVPLPYAEVNVVGGNTTFADANGNFTIPHDGSTQVTVRSRLRGQFFEVFDDIAGQAIPQVTTAVTPPGPATLLHNPTANNEFSTAGVNAYLEANVVRDYTLNFAPNYPVIANQQFFDIRVNEDDFSGIESCNAVYTGNSMVFWRNAGGCNNTAFTDVVHHEYGHHLVNVTDNGQGQLGEGSGDVMGVLIQDDPVLGQGFSNCNQGIRDARNFRTYPCTDGNSPHNCGQLLSGCVWDLRNELIVTEPVNFRDIGASLFVNMLIARGQQFEGSPTIGPEIAALYVTLDDGEHCAEILTAFGAHNLDVEDLILLEYSFPSGRTPSVDPLGGLAFEIQVDDFCEAVNPSTVTLNLQRGQGNETFNLSGSGNVFDVVFPAIECGTDFTYYFSAQTASGVTTFEPANANTNTDSRFQAVSATNLIIEFLDNAETNMGWSVSGNANDGQWNRGTPVGGGDRGDPENDGDGSGQCYLTDNVNGNSDVDGGTTTLTSPILDASGTGAVLSYWRWYSNDAGGSPNNDVFTVEISNDGGATWVNVETVGPDGPESGGGWFFRQFNVANLITPTDTVRVRFNASDLGPGSVVEAGVDGVSIDIVECGPPPTVVLPPSNVSVFRGVQTGGTFADLELSDDVFMSFEPGFTLNTSEAPVWLFMDANLPFVPDTLNVDIESNANTPGLTKTTEVFNFTTGGLDVVDTVNESFNTDSVVSLDLTADIADYVQADSNAVLVRVGWRRTGFTVLFPWEARVDQMIWTLNQ